MFYEDTVKWYLLFDSDCNLCNTFATIINRLKNKEIQVISLQKWYKYNKEIEYEELLKDIHLISSDKKIIYKGDIAINKLLIILPQSKAFIWMIESAYGKKVTKMIYNITKKIKKCCNRKK